MVNTTPRQAYALERDPVPIVEDVGWALWPVWADAKNLAITGIRYPDHPNRSESLYRLSYRGPLKKIVGPIFLCLENGMSVEPMRYLSADFGSRYDDAGRGHWEENLSQSLSSLDTHC